MSMTENQEVRVAALEAAVRLVTKSDNAVYDSSNAMRVIAIAAQFENYIRIGGRES